MKDWNGRDIIVARSKGGVVAVADVSDNLIRVSEVPWPPPAIVQKLYESRQTRAFEGDQLATATAGLGVYSDLQSLHSEDAVTWSYFGPLAVKPPEARADFLNWLLLQLGLDNWTGSERASIDLWRRVPHPDKSLPGGPELDFVIDGERCVVFGEVKWMSGEGRGQGTLKDKGQMQLRRDFFAKYGTAIYGERGFVVLGVALAGALEASAPENTDSLVTSSVTWDTLAEYAGHPKAEEFVRYLKWKRDHSRLR